VRWFCLNVVTFLRIAGFGSGSASLVRCRIPGATIPSRIVIALTAYTMANMVNMINSISNPLRCRRSQPRLAAPQPYNHRWAMIACDGCDEWFHSACLGLTDIDFLAIETYFCAECQGVGRCHIYVMNSASGPLFFKNRL
jgi:hypothetical protein